MLFISYFFNSSLLKAGRKQQREDHRTKSNLKQKSKREQALKKTKALEREILQKQQGINQSSKVKEKQQKPKQSPTIQQKKEKPKQSFFYRFLAHVRDCVLHDGVGFFGGYHQQQPFEQIAQFLKLLPEEQQTVISNNLGFSTFQDYACTLLTTEQIDLNTQNKNQIQQAFMQLKNLYLAQPALQQNQMSNQIIRHNQLQEFADIQLIFFKEEIRFAQAQQNEIYSPLRQLEQELENISNNNNNNNNNKQQNVKEINEKTTMMARSFLLGIYEQDLEMFFFSVGYFMVSGNILLYNAAISVAAEITNDESLKSLWNRDNIEQNIPKNEQQIKVVIPAYKLQLQQQKNKNQDIFQSWKVDYDKQQKQNNDINAFQQFENNDDFQQSKTILQNPFEELENETVLYHQQQSQLFKNPLTAGVYLGLYLIDLYQGKINAIEIYRDNVINQINQYKDNKINQIKQCKDNVIDKIHQYNDATRNALSDGANNLMNGGLMLIDNASNKINNYISYINNIKTLITILAMASMEKTKETIVATIAKSKEIGNLIVNQLKKPGQQLKKWLQPPLLQQQQLLQSQQRQQFSNQQQNKSKSLQQNSQLQQFQIKQPKQQSLIQQFQIKKSNMQQLLEQQQPNINEQISKYFEKIIEKKSYVDIAYIAISLGDPFFGIGGAIINIMFVLQSIILGTQFIKNLAKTQNFIKNDQLILSTAIQASPFIITSILTWLSRHLFSWIKVFSVLAIGIQILNQYVTSFSISGVLLEFGIWINQKTNFNLSPNINKKLTNLNSAELESILLLRYCLPFFSEYLISTIIDLNIKQQKLPITIESLQNDQKNLQLIQANSNFYVDITKFKPMYKNNSNTFEELVTQATIASGVLMIGWNIQSFIEKLQSIQFSQEFLNQLNINYQIVQQHAFKSIGIDPNNNLVTINKRNIGGATAQVIQQCFWLFSKALEENFPLPPEIQSSIEEMNNFFNWSKNQKYKNFKYNLMYIDDQNLPILEENSNLIQKHPHITETAKQMLLLQLNNQESALSQGILKLKSQYEFLNTINQDELVQLVVLGFNRALGIKQNTEELFKSIGRKLGYITLEEIKGQFLQNDSILRQYISEITQEYPRFSNIPPTLCANVIEEIKNILLEREMIQQPKKIITEVVTQPQQKSFMTMTRNSQTKEIGSNLQRKQGQNLNLNNKYGKPSTVFQEFKSSQFFENTPNPLGASQTFEPSQAPSQNNSFNLPEKTYLPKQTFQQQTSTIVIQNFQKQNPWASPIFQQQQQVFKKQQESQQQTQNNTFYLFNETLNKTKVGNLNEASSINLQKQPPIYNSYGSTQQEQMVNSLSGQKKIIYHEEQQLPQQQNLSTRAIKNFGQLFASKTLNTIGDNLNYDNSKTIKAFYEQTQTNPLTKGAISNQEAAKMLYLLGNTFEGKTVEMPTEILKNVGQRTGYNVINYLQKNPEGATKIVQKYIPEASQDKVAAVLDKAKGFLEDKELIKPPLQIQQNSDGKYITKAPQIDTDNVSTTDEEEDSTLGIPELKEKPILSNKQIKDNQIIAKIAATVAGAVSIGAATIGTIVASSAGVVTAGAATAGTAGTIATTVVAAV